MFLKQHRVLSADCHSSHWKIGPWISGASLPTNKNPNTKSNVILQFFLSSLLAAHRSGGQKQLLSPLPQCSSEHWRTQQSTKSRSFYCHWCCKTESAHGSLKVFLYHCWTLWRDWTSKCLIIRSFLPLISEKDKLKAVQTILYGILMLFLSWRMRACKVTHGLEGRIDK